MSRPVLRIPGCLPLLLSFACSGPEDDGVTTKITGSNADGDDDDDDASDTTPTTGSAGGPPVITDLLANAPTLAQNGAIVVSATVIDADGLDTIVGGELTTPDGSASYGDFVALGGGGYQIELTWKMIGETATIEFMGPEQVRVLRAEFVDAAGNIAERTLELRLACASGAACASECVTLETDERHCGVCGNACDQIFECSDGECYYAY